MEKKKKKEKTARRFIAFLAAACMLGTMPGVSAVSYAEESFEESLEIYGAGADGQEEKLEDCVTKELKDTEEQTDDSVQEAGDTVKETENQENTEDKRNLEESDRKDMEYKGDLEESEEIETENKADKEGTEESKDQEDTGKEDIEDTADKENTEDKGDSGDAGADKEDIPNVGDSKEEEKSGEVSGEEQDAESEKADTDENTTGEGITEEEEIIEYEEIAEDEEMVADEEIDGEVEPEEAKEDIVPLAAETDETATVEEDTTYTGENGVIYHYYAYDDGTAEIYELENYRESAWVYRALDIPAQVGDYTVTRLTFTVSSAVTTLPSVTIPETVTYMSGSLFRSISITELYYNAEAAETGAGGEGSGVFSLAYISELHIGENVKVIPDYCFANAKITMDELTLNVESIGDKAFYYNKNITTLTIGENVRAIGDQAFARNQIENINYLAVNAIDSAKYGRIVYGPFGYISVSNITIGDRVTFIPEHLFYGIEYETDTLAFPDCLTTIGAWAFYGDDITIGELTIGENVTSIGEQAFSCAKIGILNYNAVDARIDGIAEGEYQRTSFKDAKIGELRIGEHVESLPDTLFASMSLVQDTLTIPDSVTYIGAYVLSYSAARVKIGTLEIGENVTHIGRAAFGCNTYDRVVVRTVEADVVPSSSSSIELPECSEIEIHGKSPYYDFFTKRTDKDHITLLCEDFETSYGEEYYDAEKESFVTLITDACTVCGYGVTREEYSEAYTVIFIDYDGRELARQNLHKGDDATAPEDPERTGYRFTGWDKIFTNVTSNLTVRAEYEIQKFSVVFKDGDHIISEQEVNYMDSAVLPENPARPKEEWGNWHFTGWSGNHTNITKDEVVTARFEKVLNQYEVLFYDAEGNVLSRQTVAHGEDAEEPEAPQKEPTAQHQFTFTGWSAATEGITGDTAFYPVYDTEARSYTVTFRDGSTVLDTQTVEYGDDATAPEDPTRVAEEWGSWQFTGWRGSYTNIAKDEVVWAMFEKVLNTYEVTFCDAEGNVIDRQTVAHGSDATAPKAPIRPKEEWGSWHFAGWSGNYTNVTKDEVVTAQYQRVLNRYEVLFYDAEGKVISRQTVVHGENATEPEIPEKESTAQYQYTFTGWSADTESITGDTAFYPVYDAETRSYTVTFMDGSTVLDAQTVMYGEDAIAPEDPTRAEEEWGSWEFTGWRGSYTHITKDEVIRAVFEKILNEYEVIFYDAEDNILSRQTVKHGMGAEVPEAPAMEPTEEECYVFTGWDGDVSHITEESHFHPLYETKTRTYTVTFMNGVVTHDVQEVEYGESAVTPSAPTRKADQTYTYKFVGWDQDFSFITGDLTVQAVFEPVKKPKGDEKEKEKQEDKEPGGQEPGDGDGDDGGDGGTDGEPDGGSTPDGEPEGESGEETPDPVPEILTEIKILSQGVRPYAVQEKNPVFEMPEIPEKSIQPEEKGVQTEEPESQEPMQEEDTETDKKHWQIPLWLWLLLLVGAGTGILSVLLAFIFDEKRVVCGIVLDKDGKAMRGMKVTLAGQEEETMETQTDKNGQYMFDSLEKDDYRLCLCDKDASSLLLLDIRMGRCRSKKVFAVLKDSVVNVETKRSGRKYQIDVTV